MGITAVLPVTGLGKKEYVRDLRDEVKIGDIIKAKVSKITKTGVDISIAGPESGFLCVFCPKCRNRMDLKDINFICNACEWKERRKTPRE
jgi:exosome complex component CSL4